MAKSLLSNGWTPGALVTVRVAGAAAILLIPAVVSMRGRWWELRQHAVAILSYGVAAVAGCQLAYFYAVTHLSVGVALLLEYLAPVLIVGLLWVRHRQRPRRLTVAGVVLALGGLLLVLDVLGGVRISAVGVMWGLLAALGLVVYFTIAARDENALPPLALAGGGLLVGSLVLAVAGIAGLVPMRFATADVELVGRQVAWWIPVLELMLVAAALAYVTGIMAARLLGTKVASFVSLTEVLFAVVFAWILLGELPRPVQLVGGLLIVAGVVAVRTDELRAPAPVAEPQTAELQIAEPQTAELGTAELRTAELRTAELQTAELQTAEPRSTQAADQRESLPGRIEAEPEPV
jgi:drug/metabolite transporter (DMT)-like permease